MTILWNIILIVLITVKITYSEVFTSTGEMVKLVQTEAQVTEHLEYFLNKHLQEIQKAKQYD